MSSVFDGIDAEYAPNFIIINLLYILNAVRCPYVHTYVRTSVTLGVASSANDVIMRMTL